MLRSGGSTPASDDSLGPAAVDELDGKAGNIVGGFGIGGTRRDEQYHSAGSSALRTDVVNDSGSSDDAEEKSKTVCGWKKKSRTCFPSIPHRRSPLCMQLLNIMLSEMVFAGDIVFTLICCCSQHSFYMRTRTMIPYLHRHNLPLFK